MALPPREDGRAHDRRQGGHRRLVGRGLPALDAVHAAVPGPLGGAQPALTAADLRLAARRPPPRAEAGDDEGGEDDDERAPRAPRVESRRPGRRSPIVAPAMTAVGRHQRRARAGSASAVAGIAAARAPATWPTSSASAVTTTAGPTDAVSAPVAQRHDDRPGEDEPAAGVRHGRGDDRRPRRRCRRTRSGRPRRGRSWRAMATMQLTSTVARRTTGTTAEQAGRRPHRAPPLGHRRPRGAVASRLTSRRTWSSVPRPCHATTGTPISPS